jgi:hypothetical protein
MFVQVPSAVQLGSEEEWSTEFSVFSSVSLVSQWESEKVSYSMNEFVSELPSFPVDSSVQCSSVVKKWVQYCDQWCCCKVMSKERTGLRIVSG